jgi:uncharacterized membrane protein YagU involved in acid resistance
MQSKTATIVISGIIATAAMTLMGIIAPVLGMPKMMVGNMLAGFMGVPMAVGWIAHFIIGIILAAGYVLVVGPVLPGSRVVRGMLYSLIPFILAQIAVMPIMGAGFFSSNTPAPAMMVMASLIGHLVYGAILGLTARNSPSMEQNGS